MKDRKPIYFTSDLHLGHANSIVFDKRPFTDLDHMHRVLINNFNSTVSPDAVTYFLGDIGMGSPMLLKALLAQFNGTKVLCLGNHDKQHNSMYNLGFDVVLNGAVLNIAGHRVTMSHCPLLGVYREDTVGMSGAQPGAMWHGDHRLQAYSFKDDSQFHLHGHCHTPNGGRSQRVLGKQMDVGVVANGYKPVSISVVESWIAKYAR